MLTVEERRGDRGEACRLSEHRQAVCIEAMLIIQRHQGWVSDEKLRDLSELLGLSVADLDGVATFYNLIRRKPVGRHVALDLRQRLLLDHGLRPDARSPLQQIGHAAWRHNCRRALYLVAHRLPGSV